MSIIMWIISFFVSAFALKIALAWLGTPTYRNAYKTAVTTCASLTLVSILLTFVPIFGFLIYGVLWIITIRGVYRLTMGKAIGVAVLQVLIRGILMLTIGWLI